MKFRRLILATLTLFPAFSIAATDIRVEVTWNAPKERVDGTPLPIEEIEKYRLFIDPPGPKDMYPLDVPKTVDGFSHTTPFVEDGDYCFWMTTIDTEGQESEESGKVCLYVKNPEVTQSAKPGHPNNLNVIITY